MATTNLTITFRPLREADLPLLHDWIQRPHVAEWWGGGDASEDFEDTKAKYLPRLQEASSVKLYIALLSGQPIGFTQSYVALGCGDGWWKDETDPGVRGIDQFLCDGGKLGQGLGTRLVTAFVRKLFEDPCVTKVQTDPDPTNARAIRCYEKAGFRPVGKITTPDGPALLMVVERAAAEERPSATSGASIPTDDRRRNSLGVVACAVSLEGGRVRLCFDDVKSRSANWPHEWQTESLYTWLECDAVSFAESQFSERQLADIGLTLVARLAGLAKA